MQKLEAAAIPMQKNFKGVQFLFPNEFVLEDFIQNHSIEPFAEETVDYLNALSKELFKDSRTRLYPDVATFGFFCRRANILVLKRKDNSNDVVRLGRGILFHIAPSNVPVNFAYSLISGLLAGNINIVRVPSKHFEQIDIIIEAIEILNNNPKYQFLSSRIALVQYDRNSSATKYFSSLCDVRIIWGGDETISQIRENKIPPRSFDVTFADRYSLCAINADKYVKEKFPNKIAQAFYNDTYLFDQNACTAPHLVIWLGSNENVKLSKRVFWDSLYEFIKIKYTVQPVIAVDKLTSFYYQAVKLNKIQKEETIDNLIWRVELNDLAKEVEEYRCSSGYFSEYHAASLSELSSIINRKYQTLSYYGIPNQVLKEFVINEKPSGIDRIVPIGKASDFSLVWDGYDLVKSLSRQCDIF